MKIIVRCFLVSLVIIAGLMAIWSLWLGDTKVSQQLSLYEFPPQAMIPSREERAQKGSSGLQITTKSLPSGGKLYTARNSEQEFQLKLQTPEGWVLDDVAGSNDLTIWAPRSKLWIIISDSEPADFDLFVGRPNTSMRTYNDIDWYVGESLTGTDDGHEIGDDYSAFGKINDLYVSIGGYARSGELSASLTKDERINFYARELKDVENEVLTLLPRILLEKLAEQF